VVSHVRLDATVENESGVEDRILAETVAEAVDAGPAPR